MIGTKKTKNKGGIEGEPKDKIKDKLKAKSKLRSLTPSVNGQASPAKGNPNAQHTAKANGKKANGKEVNNKTLHEQQLQASSNASALLSRLQVLAQYLKDLSFESPNAPQIFTAQQGQTPQFSLDISVSSNKLAHERHEVTMVIKVAMTRGEEACFLVEIVYAGLVAVPEPAPSENLLQALLLIEVPRLLFPYARNILSELTQSSGFPPLVVQPVDFAALYRKQLAEARAAIS